ncbi:MAG: Virulence plasmid protein pGP6-D-related protein [Chlamydiales bacterium]|jgi:hypothetical protein|nr:Virulence plasmid protein pGP6-D-related protein [Chlamydiales bacterium]
MTKANSLASQFLARSAKTSDAPLNPFQQGQSGPKNAFRSLFDVQALEQEEAKEIEEILLHYAPEENDEEKIQADLRQLKTLTSEIQSISRQSILLLGERLHKAQTLLKNYGDGKKPFTEWLNKAFRSRKTAYNALSYYSLYQKMPTDALKNSLKQMPQKVAYILASREGDLDKKLELIASHHQQKQELLIALIQEWFPLNTADKRQNTSPFNLIRSIELSLKQLQKISLSKEARQALRHLKDTIDTLL